MTSLKLGPQKGDHWRKHRAEEGLIPVLSYKGSIPPRASLEQGSPEAWLSAKKQNLTRLSNTNAINFLAELIKTASTHG